MRTRNVVIATLLAAGGITGVAFAAFGARKPSVERIDFGVTKRSIKPSYDATLAKASDASIKEFVIPITNDTIELASGVKYEGWTFGGTVPGPVIRVRQGDLVRVTVVNHTAIPHSIDFHAARIPANVAYRMIMPKDSVKFEFTANDAGAFMVHCGTPPVTMHLMQGMYFAIIVDPANGYGTKADKEFVLVQSEFYAMQDPKTKAMSADWNAAMAKNPSQVVFNGKAFQYKDAPLHVDVGDRVRFFVVNAGPSLTSDFHIVGAIFDRVYPDGDPRHALSGVQTYPVPAGGGVVFETVFSKAASGEGIYAFVTHSFADAERGAVGLIQVGTPKTFTTMNH